MTNGKDWARIDTTGDSIDSRTAPTVSVVPPLVQAERERCAAIADAMALNPWGAPHDGLTPYSLAKMIARAIRGQ